MSETIGETVERVKRARGMQKGAPKQGRKAKNMQSATVQPARNKGYANLIPYKPGECGNPKGRPSLREELEALMLEDDELRGCRKTRALAVSLYNLAVGGSIQAHHELWDRLEGAPKQAVTIEYKNIAAKIEDYTAEAAAVVAYARGVADAACIGDIAGDRAGEPVLSAQAAEEPTDGTQPAG